ncbi:MAG: fibronectin type III domain-containing protein [Thermoanaerobaculales bacterium]
MKQQSFRPSLGGRALALVIAVAAASAPALAAIPSSERQALIDVYNSTNGSAWKNSTGWLGVAGTECDWYGVACNSEETSVNRLWLDDNNLGGTIPASIGDLTGLVEFRLPRNTLSGSIPGEIGDLVNLTGLHLQANQLTGTIPATLANLSALERLELEHNQLNGALPAWLGNLTALSHVNLGSNQLTGPIPTEIGNLTHLEYLVLGWNPLGGAIPASFGGLTSLISLGLACNQLTGPIPSELGSLAGLTWLDLSYNPIGGELPGFLGNMSALTTLKLNGCQLSGTIPSELANLANLTSLELFSNEMTGGVPAFLGNLSKLKVLMLARNRLTGGIPSSLGNLSALENLWLYENALIGDIPGSLTGLVNLEVGSLDLTYNGLWTQDPALAAFLDSKQRDGDWRSTQTVAPAGVAATATSTTSVAVSWTPITYTDDAGGYRVSYATASGGPYTYSGRTTTKSASSLEITGLTPGDYFIIVESETDAHDYQKNAVTSEPSGPVWVSTNGGAQQSASQQAISLIANVDGKLGSHWVSDIKITNPYDQAITVVLQGTPHNTSAGASDPTLTRTIQPGATLGIEDVYGALFGTQAEGKARLLITATDSQGVGIGAPIVTSNIYNAAPGGGEFQTYGAPIEPTDLAQVGTVLGDNTVKGVGERYNFDVTTGSTGATIRYTYRDAVGGDERSATVGYKANATRQHVDAQKLFSLSALAPDSSIIAEIQAGSAFIRGTPTNNTTSDGRSQPWQEVVDTLQQAGTKEAWSAATSSSSIGQVISLIANVDGKLGSHWMSDVKITNPFAEAIMVVLKGTPHATSASPADPEITRVLQPGETLGIEDVYGALFGGQAEGKARLIVNTSNLAGDQYAFPIITSNIYNAAANGGEFQTYGPPVRTDRFYQAGTMLGDNTVKGPGERYNFDVVAGLSGATILYTYRDSSGGDERIAIVYYQPVATRQHVDARKLFGLSALAPNSSIVASIQAGAAFIRGTPTNNITNDGRSQPWQPVSGTAP